MNLAIRDIDNNGIKWGDSFHKVLKKYLKADFLLSNPLFND
jgi:type I restriction enzyme M protein